MLRRLLQIMLEPYLFMLYSPVMRRCTRIFTTLILTTFAVAAFAIILITVSPPYSQAQSVLTVRKAPKALVVIAFDQMRGDYPAEFGKLWSSHGFNRLIREGAYFPRCYFDHASNITAPGHSVHLTGVYPHKSGIVSNDFFDRVAGRSLYCVQDSLHKTFGMKSPSEWHSPSNLKASTLGTYLKQRSPKSKVIGVSQKDRAAILMSGHHADAAYWFEAEASGFTTSDYYTPTMPAWLATWNKENHFTKYAGSVWMPVITDPQMQRPDSLPFEALPRGQFVFPYQLPSADSVQALAQRFLLSPFAVEHVFAFAKTVFLREQIGKDRHTDIFCLSISTTDYVGHQFGPQSREIAELYVHVDRLLGDFLTFLDSTVGRGQYAVAITSDHGVAPVPEYIKLTQGDTADAGRIKTVELLEHIEQSMATAFPNAAVSKWVRHIEPPSLFLTNEALSAGGHSASTTNGASNSAPTRVVLLDTLCAILLRFPGIGIAVSAEHLAANRCPNGLASETFALIRRDFFPQRTGEVMYYPHPNWIQTSITATHGTPHLYDRHVPMIFFNAGLPAGRYNEQVSPADIAPTLAQMLGITMKNIDGRALSTVLKYPERVPKKRQYGQ